MQYCRFVQDKELMHAKARPVRNSRRKIQNLHSRLRGEEITPQENIKDRTNNSGQNMLNKINDKLKTTPTNGGTSKPWYAITTALSRGEVTAARARNAKVITSNKDTKTSGVKNIDIQNAINYLKNLTSLDIMSLPKDQREEAIKQALIARYGIQGYNEILKNKYAQIRHALFDLDNAKKSR